MVRPSPSARDSYTDGVDLPQEIFTAARMEASQNPKTSSPRRTPFCASLKPRRTQATAWCILISSALSGTMQSALIAAGMVEDLDIALVDSLTPRQRVSAAGAGGLPPARRGQ